MLRSTTAAAVGMATATPAADSSGSDGGGSPPRPMVAAAAATAVAATATSTDGRPASAFAAKPAGGGSGGAAAAGERPHPAPLPPTLSAAIPEEPVPTPAGITVDAAADHVVLIVHGIGDQSVDNPPFVMSLARASRHMSTLVAEVLGATRDVHAPGHVAFHPVEWHSKLHSGDAGWRRAVESITPDAVRQLRGAILSSAGDVMMFMSPRWHEFIIEEVLRQINAVYAAYACGGKGGGGGGGSPQPAPPPPRQQARRRAQQLLATAAQRELAAAGRRPPLCASPSLRTPSALPSCFASFGSTATGSRPA